jgi:hypothetical protein
MLLKIRQSSFRLIYFVLTILLLAACSKQGVVNLVSTAPPLVLEPALISLSTEQSQQFYSPTVSSRIDYSVYAGSGSISSEGLYTAPSAPSNVIIRGLDLNDRAQYANIEVIAPPILSVDSSLLVGQTIPVAVAGGKAPYTFSVVSLNSSQLGAIENGNKFRSPLLAGTNLIRVTDSLGASSEASVEFKSNLSFGANSVIANSPVILSVTGGIGDPAKFRYHLVGAGSFNPANMTFTPIAYENSAILAVTDGGGNKASVLLNTTSGSQYESLIINTSIPSVSVGGNVQLVVEGSQGSDLTFEIISGGGSVSSGGVFTAPASSGTTIIKVTDSSGHSGTVSIPINPTLSTAIGSTSSTLFSEIDISQNGEVSISPSGGTGPYTVTTHLGSIKDGSTAPSNSKTGNGPFIYKAPDQVGIDWIKITDSAGESKTYSVKVNENLRLSPQSIFIKKEEQFQFAAFGGKPPYAYQLLSGAGTIDSSSGLFVASNEAGETIIKVVDSASNESTAKVVVLNNLLVDPFYKVTTVQKISEIKINGGLAPYTVNLKTGTGRICETVADPLANSTCTYTQITSTTGFYFKSPAAQSTEILEISDSSGLVVSITIKVEGPLTLTASKSSLDIAENTRINVNGGIGPYSLSIDNNNLASIEQTTSTSWNLLALSNGSAVLTVTDSEGSQNSVTLSLTVPSPIATIGSIPTSVTTSNTMSAVVSGAYISHYKYKVGIASSLDCSNTGGYSSEQSVSQAIVDSVAGLADGEIKLCVIGKNIANVWQSESSASTAQWQKETQAPSAIISGAPSGVNSQSTGTVIVSGSSVSKYKYQIANGTTSASCTGSYSNEFSIAQNLNLVIAGDGPKVLCILGKGQVLWQTTPTTVSWTADFTAPVFASTIEDGIYSTSTTSSNTITFADATESTSSLSGYESRVMNGTTVVQDWSPIASGSPISGLSLSHGLTYKVQIRAKNSAGLYSTSQESNGWLVDTQAPTAPSQLTLGSTPTIMTETPTLSWTASTDLNSGLSHYQVQLWKDEATDIQVKDWVNISVGGKLDSGFTLIEDATYYFKLKAVDNAGNISAITTSPTWIASTAADCINTIPAPGAKCTGNVYFVSSFNGGKYLTTPGNCTNSATPTCNNSADTLYKATGTWQVSTERQNPYDGLGNTLDFVARTNTPASEYCYNLVYGGYSDWFLPAIYELQRFYYDLNETQRTNMGININVGYSYWASGESGSTDAYELSFYSGYNGTVYTRNKTNSNLVRCVRKVDRSPDLFNFTTITGAAANSIQQSNVVTVNGFDGRLTYTVSGAVGSPQIRKSTDGGSTWSAWNSSIEIQAGQQMQLQVTVGANSTTPIIVVLSQTEGITQNWLVNPGSTDPCSQKPTPGTLCGDGTYYVGDFQGFSYRVTPSGCTDSATPTCNHGGDTLGKVYGATTNAWHFSLTDGAAMTSTYATTFSDTYATKYCNNMVYAGHSDWFLPARDEAFIMMNQMPLSMRNSLGFNTSGNTYWTSSSLSASLAYTYWLNYSNGNTLWASRGASKLVRCIRKVAL